MNLHIAKVVDSVGVDWPPHIGTVWEHTTSGFVYMSLGSATGRVDICTGVTYDGWDIQSLYIELRGYTWTR